VEGEEQLSRARFLRGHGAGGPVYGPPTRDRPRRRFRSREEERASVERLYTSGNLAQTLGPGDARGAARRGRPQTAQPGRPRAGAAGGPAPALARPQTAPAGGRRLAQFQCAGALSPFGGATRRLTPEEQEAVVGRLYTIRERAAPVEPRKGWVRYRMEEGRPTEYFHEAETLPDEERTGRLVALGERCREREEETQRRLTDKWLQPLCSPKVYGPGAREELAERTQRLFKGESALDKKEIRRALRGRRQASGT